MLDYKERLKYIVDTGYDILINKIDGGSVVIDNEAGLQLQFSYILKCIGELFKYSLDDIFAIELEKNIELNEYLNKSGTRKAKIDIFLILGNKEKKYTCAIELKYFKKENNREPNNRYDVFNDLNNLEIYRNNEIDLCYFIIGTNHTHYVNQKSYSQNTEAFDFRDGKKYVRNKILAYNTANPYGANISLNNDYSFEWDIFNNKYFLKLEVKNGK